MKHLRILYGIDERYDIVHNTLSVCEGYFTTIKVVNSGPATATEKLRQFHPSVIFEELDWFTGDQEPLRRAFYYDVPDGDWVVWLDSDERPSQEFLENIDVVISENEVTGFCNLRIPYRSHHWGLNGDGNWVIGKPWEDPMRPMPKTKSELWNRTDIPCSIHDRMFKRTKRTCSMTNFGGHGYIIGDRKYTLPTGECNNWGFCPYPINHYKDDPGSYLSAVLHNFTTPCRLTSYKDSAKLVENSDVYQHIKKFQLAERVFTTNELVSRAKADSEFKQRLHALFSDPVMNKDIESTCYGCNKVWVEKFGGIIEETLHRCGSSCCKYKNIQL